MKIGTVLQSAIAAQKSRSLTARYYLGPSEEDVAKARLKVKNLAAQLRRAKRKLRKLENEFGEILAEGRIRARAFMDELDRVTKL